MRLSPDGTVPCGRPTTLDVQGARESFRDSYRGTRSTAPRATPRVPGLCCAIGAQARVSRALVIAALLCTDERVSRQSGDVRMMCSRRQQGRHDHTPTHTHTHTAATRGQTTHRCTHTQRPASYVHQQLSTHPSGDSGARCTVSHQLRKNKPLAPQAAPTELPRSGRPGRPTVRGGN